MIKIKWSKRVISALVLSAALVVLIVLMSPVVSCRVTELASSMSTNGTGRDLSQVPKLTVGTDTSYPPFEFLNQEGKAEGFDIDVITEIGNRLGKEIEIKSVAYDSLYQELDAGNIDLAISALPILEDKKNAVDYSDAYYTLEYLLISLSDTQIMIKEDMASKDVGILRTAKEGLSEEVLARYRIADYEDIKVMMDDLKAKNIEGVLISKPIAINILNQDGMLYRVLDTIKSKRDFVIAMGKNSQILEDINQAIAQMAQDGTAAEIYDKWFVLQ